MKRGRSTVEMRRSWLVQRLEAPRSSAFGDANPFAFGGGRRNGGLSDEAMGLLSKVFRFDYMGAAEFEFGAIPKALNAVAADAAAYTASSFTILLSEVEADWRAKAQPTTPTGEATLFVVCRGAHVDEVEDRIRGMAAGTVPLKERTNLAAALRPANEWDTNVCGWLELDNGFFFFTDRTMWSQTARLFGIAERSAS